MRAVEATVFNMLKTRLQDPCDKIYEKNIAKINIMKKHRFKINLNKNTKGTM